MIDNFIEFNKKFVEEKGYEKYRTTKYPDKKVAILSCMDTRLTELLPAALGIKNGDVKIIKNAGGVITHPFGSVMRSLLVAIFELGVTDVMVIGHTDCGVQHINGDFMKKHMLARGIEQEVIDMVSFCGIDFDKWLEGFECVEKSVEKTVDFIADHPLMPKDINVYGFIMDSVTGQLTMLKEIERRK
jgi:carbonic anhydrase